MKIFNAVLLTMACLFALSACVEDEGYYNDQYYSTATPRAYPSSVNSGYNRDYQPARPPVNANSGYSSTAQNQAAPPVAAPVRMPLPPQAQTQPQPPVSVPAPSQAQAPVRSLPPSQAAPVIEGKGNFAAILAKVPAPATSGYSSTASR